MRILVISDTHGHSRNLEKILKKEGDFDLLLHCGDVEGEADYIEALLSFPCYFVAGNCDDYSSLPQECVVECNGKRIGITHGHYLDVYAGHDRLVEKAKEKNCDIVCYGHIHRPGIWKENEITILNPGSLSYPRQEGHRPSYAVGIQSENGEIAFQIRYL